SWMLDGEISGGAISYSGGARLIYTGGTLNSVAVPGSILLDSANDSVALIDVPVPGELLLSGSNSRANLGGATSFSAARLIGGGSILNLNGNYTLNSLVSAEGSDYGTRQVSFAGGNTFASSAIVRLSSGCGGDLHL